MLVKFGVYFSKLLMMIMMRCMFILCIRKPP